MLSALERLLARRPPAAVKFGLERIRALLESMSDPQLRFRAIHVAGTNGKGSVAATAASILRWSGRRTGLYTSPHLVSFAERIVVDGEPANGALLDDLAAELLPEAERVDATFFEATTALAFAAFARAGVQDAVVEVGLGGRLDATNVLEAEVAVVTSIDRDHAEYLGADLGGIAREKAGIFAEGATAVLGRIEGAARRELLLAAERTGAGVEAWGEQFTSEDVRELDDGVAFTFRSGRRADVLPLRSPLRGGHQAVNVATAVAAVDALLARGPAEHVLPGETVAAGVSAVRWPGRFQVVRGERAGDPARVYDIAHNPAAARVLADLLERHLERGHLSRPVVLLAAVLGDKDWREVLGPILAVCDRAVLTDAPSAPEERRWNLHAAAQELSRRFPLRVEPDFDHALATAADLAGNGTVLVTGSCYTVGDAMQRDDATRRDDAMQRDDATRREHATRCDDAMRQRDPMQPDDADTALGPH